MINSVIFNISDNENRILYSSAFIGAILYLLVSDTVVMLFTILSYIFTLITCGPKSSLGHFIVLAPFNSDSTFVAIYFILTVAVFFISTSYGNLSKYTIILIPVFLIFMFCSYYWGIMSRLENLILHITCVFLFFSVCDVNNDDRYGLLIYSFLISALSIVFVVVIESILGINVLKFGRLAFKDNIRTLANACFIPLLFLINGFFHNKLLFSKIKKNQCIVIIACLLFPLILTVSRGAYIALAVLILLCLLASKENHRLYKLILVSVIACIIVAGMYNIDYIRLDRWSGDDLSSFNGRTDIWKNYWYIMSDSGICNILFGLGPGDIKRFTVGTAFDDMYAHSTYLDIFFSYGICGLTLFFGCLFCLFVKLLRSFNNFFIILFVPLIICFLTSGTVFNYQMYTVLGIICGLSKSVYFRGLFVNE